MEQHTYLSSLCESNPDAVYICSLGTISYDMADKPVEKVLIKGAMGAAMSCGLGYALGTEKQVIVLIGDGSFIMKAGHASTILNHNLPNLRVIVLNNGQYKSCGGQKTTFRKGLCPFEVVDVE